MSLGYNNLLPTVIANPARGLWRRVKRSPAREAVAKSMRYISWRGWLHSPYTGTASLPMTYFCSFVIANPACWLRQGVKRSPTRGTRTASIRSHTRGGQLRNPPTNYASLPMTYLVLIVIANPAGWLQQGVKRSPTHGTRTGSIRSHTRRGQLRNPPTSYASLAVTIIFTVLSFHPSIFAKMVPPAMTICLESKT